MPTEQPQPATHVDDEHLYELRAAFAGEGIDHVIDITNGQRISLRDGRITPAAPPPERE